MFFFCGLAFMVMKWRARGIWENSSLPKSGLAGHPVDVDPRGHLLPSSWAATSTCSSGTRSASTAVGYKNRASFIFMGSLYVAARRDLDHLVDFVRKRQGMELEAVAKEIPVE